MDQPLLRFHDANAEPLLAGGELFDLFRGARRFVVRGRALLFDPFHDGADADPDLVDVGGDAPELLLDACDLLVALTRRVGDARCQPFHDPGDDVVRIGYGGDLLFDPSCALADGRSHRRRSRDELGAERFHRLEQLLTDALDARSRLRQLRQSGAKVLHAAGRLRGRAVQRVARVPGDLHDLGLHRVEAHRQLAHRARDTVLHRTDGFVERRAKVLDRGRDGRFRRGCRLRFVLGTPERRDLRADVVEYGIPGRPFGRDQVRKLRADLVQDRIRCGGLDGRQPVELRPDVLKDRIGRGRLGRREPLEVRADLVQDRIRFGGLCRRQPVEVRADLVEDGIARRPFSFAQLEQLPAKLEELASDLVEQPVCRLRRRRRGLGELRSELVQVLVGCLRSGRRDPLELRPDLVQDRVARRLRYRKRRELVVDLLQHRIARRRFPHGDERVQLLADLIQPCVAGLPIDPRLERRHPLAQPGFDVAHAPFDAAQGLEQHAVVGRGPRRRRPDRFDLLADRLQDPCVLRFDRAPTLGDALCLLRQVLQRRCHADGHVRDPQPQRVAAALGRFLLSAHEHFEVASDLCRRFVEQPAEVIEACVDLRPDALGT